MYESPIRIIQKQFEKSVENEIFKAVCNVGVDVDKEELIRALQYDRDQYNRGFKDGLEASSMMKEEEKRAKSKWEIDCDGYYPYCPKCGEEPPGRCMTDYCPNCGADMRGE